MRRHERFQFFLAPALLLLFLSALWDFPATPSGRRAVRTREISPPAPTFDESAARVLSFFAALLLSLLFAASPAIARAATGEPIAAPSALEEIVAALAAKETRSAEDYAALAQASIDFAQQPSPTTSAALPGILQDGLQAVDRGEREDPGAADWPALRARLQELEEEREQQQEQQEQQGQGEEQEDPGSDETSSEGTQDSSSEGEQPTSESDSGDNQDGSPSSEQATSGDQEPSAQNEPSSGEASSAENESASDPTGSGEQEDASEEPRPIAAPEASLADSESDNPPESATPPSPPEETRIVGGGTGRDEDLLRENPELAEAIERMERVSEGDSPATLFQRMRGEDAPQEQDGGKNW